MYYTIGEMSQILNIPASTLRYYDKEGLLPFVERNSSGIRRFKDSDYEALSIINCLKSAGMPIRDIKRFVDMVAQGDASIQERLLLIKKQREKILLQLEETQKILDILDFKKWYYETAAKAGTTKVPREMSDEELPEKLREIRCMLRDIHYQHPTK